MIKRFVYIALLLATTVQAQDVVIADFTPDEAGPSAALWNPPWQHPGWFSMDALSRVDMTSPVSDDALNRGLVAWWLPLPSTKGGAVLYDLMGRHHGTLENMDPATDWVATERGIALDFDGSSGHVAIDDTIMTVLDMTISVWIRVSVFDTPFQPVIAQGEGADWRIQRNSSGNTLQFNVGGATSSTIGATSVNDGLWHHVVVTQAASASAIWLDGADDTASGGEAALSGLIGPFEIGRNPDQQSRVFEGSITDIRIYSRALSAAEVRALYDNDRRGYYRTLNYRQSLALWQFIALLLMLRWRIKTLRRYA